MSWARSSTVRPNLPCRPSARASPQRRSCWRISCCASVKARRWPPKHPIPEANSSGALSIFIQTRTSLRQVCRLWRWHTLWICRKHSMWSAIMKIFQTSSSGWMKTIWHAIRHFGKAARTYSVPRARRICTSSLPPMTGGQTRLAR